MLENDVKKVIDGVSPFHMAGHKRQKEWLDGLCELDITEISGADDLHEPSGIIREAQSRAAELFGTISTIFLTGGSTCGVLSAISALCNNGDPIVIARNCHKSVYNACGLKGLKPEYLLPAVKPRLGIYGEILSADVDVAMKKSGARVVVITSPTYEGVVSDIKTIGKTVHKNGGVLIVDSAHGAHLGFDDYYPKSARQLGADIVIESAHKTLPCLTGSALLHLCSHRVSYFEIQKNLGIFETSSPSYPILCSIHRALSAICEKDLFSPYVSRLENFYEQAKSLKLLGIFETADFDKGKIVISTEKAEISGFELKERLLKDYKIELEMAMPLYAVAMTSIADTDEGFGRLITALLEIDGGLSPRKEPLFIIPPKPVFSEEGSFDPSFRETLPLSEAIGRVSTEFLWAYPPGSPILAPNEAISEEIFGHISFLSSFGAQLYSSEGKFPPFITVFGK